MSGKGKIASLSITALFMALCMSAPAYARIASDPAVTTPPPSGGSGGTSSTCNDSLLGVPAWYRGLQDGSCNISMPKAADGSMDAQKVLMTIALNIIQAALVIVAYVTIFFIIKGGFGYITSAGDSAGMASAKKTITNALIGLLIAVFSASIVNAIAGFIK